MRMRVKFSLLVVALAAGVLASARAQDQQFDQAYAALHQAVQSKIIQACTEAKRPMATVHSVIRTANGQVYLKVRRDNGQEGHIAATSAYGAALLGRPGARLCDPLIEESKAQTNGQPSPAQPQSGGTLPTPASPADPVQPAKAPTPARPAVNGYSPQTRGINSTR